MKLGPEPRGLIGSGIVESAPYPDAHWDGTPVKTGLYVDVTFDVLSPDPIVPKAVLDKPPFDTFTWSSRISGVSIPPAIAEKLAKVWQKYKASYEARQAPALPDDAAQPSEELYEARSGQGFITSYGARVAIERHAMNVATKFYESKGYAVEDHSASKPYDLLCKRKKERLYVEVKGTKTAGEQVLLTANEVDFASRNHKQMALFLLHSIKTSRDGLRAYGGRRRIVHPWRPKEEDLKPISYFYSI